MQSPLKESALMDALGPAASNLCAFQCLSGPGYDQSQIGTRNTGLQVLQRFHLHVYRLSISQLQEKQSLAAVQSRTTTARLETQLAKVRPAMPAYHGWPCITRWMQLIYSQPLLQCHAHFYAQLQYRVVKPALMYYWQCITNHALLNHHIVMFLWLHAQAFSPKSLLLLGEKAVMYY